MEEAGNKLCLFTPTKWTHELYRELLPVWAVSPRLGRDLFRTVFFVRYPLFVPDDHPFNKRVIFEFRWIRGQFADGQGPPFSSFWSTRTAPNPWSFPPRSAFLRKLRRIILRSTFISWPTLLLLTYQSNLLLLFITSVILSAFSNLSGAHLSPKRKSCIFGCCSTEVW